VDSLAADLAGVQDQLESSLKQERKKTGIVAELQQQLAAEQSRLQDAMQSSQQQKKLLLQSQQECADCQSALTGEKSLEHSSHMRLVGFLVH